MKEKLIFTRFLAPVILCAAATGCGPVNDVFLVGQVYDGALGTRIPDYTMAVVYRDKTIDAEVAKPGGRFLVEHLPVFQDYTVEITAKGFRGFRSHNPMFNLPNPNAQDRPDDSSAQTFYFDAYLFPAGLKAPPVTLTVHKDTSMGELASGKVRIRPTSESLLADTTAETPAGVGNQLWENDEDLQAKSIDKTFTNGAIDLAEGDLVYGVHYLVSIYDVDGYQPFEGTLTAGVDSSRTLVLTAATSDPLQLALTNAATCTKPGAPTDTQAAVVTFQFSLPIEFAMSPAPGGFAEIVDNAFNITWPNTNADATTNTLAQSLSSSVQERGTTSVISGNTITFAWNPNVGLTTKDPADICSSVRWNVGSVQVQPVGKPTQKVFLSTVYPNASAITCF
jgi:hypothetical protein